MNAYGLKGALALALAAGIACPLAAMAQQLDANGIGRTEVVRHAFDGGREALQVKVDFGPHVAFPKHSHPGVEIAYVLEGAIEYVVDGKPITLKAGQSLYIPAGAVHSARNLGGGIASELATYVVDKHKPVLVLDQPSK
ncbi:cupin domain-containing protein [Telluria aromaticivorans]|uniref:Cupin domain-containing protein n=1 Tax=Telluria aromaticivorans TaxID=2725995 RepID=A0A7Y2JYI4_9BURK|nr:cupin domain-containing protein [Telluria aromaticivorans]NNG23332.1 cupin domain-containing protein [Telluria aromaticivorans]